MDDGFINPSDFVEGLLEIKGTIQPGLLTTLPEFFDEYTLHDSKWIGLAVDIYEADLVIRFDAHWSNGRIPHPGARVQQWPRLVITMSQLESAHLDFGRYPHDKSLMDAASTPHSTKEGMSTSLFSFFDGTAELVHREIVELRMLDPEGGYIPIPFPPEAARAIPIDPEALPSKYPERLRIARSRRASPVVLKRLLTDEHGEVRKAAIENFIPPSEAIEELLEQEPNKSVIRVARKRLKRQARIENR